MSLRPQSIKPVPSQTEQLAKAALDKGNLDLIIRDELGKSTRIGTLKPYFPEKGKSAIAPGQLALISVMQYIDFEPLSTDLLHDHSESM